MSRPRVLLADDHALLLGAFEKLLADEFDIVGQVSDGRAVVAAAETLNPDVVVLDISMPLLNGLEAGRQIKQKSRGVKLVFLTMNEDADLAAEAFRSGASAYVLKRSAASELMTAIREVVQGRSYITPLITEGVVGSLLNVDETKNRHAADRRLPQIPDDGTDRRQIDRRTGAVCCQAPHRLTSRACCWLTTTRPCSFARRRSWCRYATWWAPRETAWLRAKRRPSCGPT
jgi:DNA-binding NarL/FixJ family response regulator